MFLSPMAHFRLGYYVLYACTQKYGNLHLGGMQLTWFELKLKGKEKQ